MLLRLTSFITLALLVTAPALAQTGAGLVQEPWETDTRLQLGASARWHDSADIDDTQNELELMRYDSRGRFRPTTQDEEPFRLGYRLLHLDLDTADPALPERLTDVSMGASWTHTMEQGRRISVIGGAGYAGDAPFGEEDAVYLIGNVIFEQPLDRKSKLNITLDYNGNRAIFPDVPLPAVSYSRRVSDQFIYTVGVPFSSVRWRPDDRWLVSARYIIPVSVDLMAEYRLTDTWRLFGQFDSTFDGFVVNGNEDRRLFFQQRRVEAGVRYRPGERVSAVLTAGFAFDQQFERGWDVRDTVTVREIDSTPFVRGSVTFSF